LIRLCFYINKINVSQIIRNNLQAATI